MPANPKMTPHHVARITAMHRERASAREIGEAIGIHYSTVARWMRALNLAPHGGGGARANRVRPPLARVESEAADAADAGQELASVEGAAPGDESALQVAQRRLEQFRRVLDAEAPNLKLGTFPPTLYKSYAELEARAALLVQRLQPPHVADPDRDPTNQEAAKALVEKLRHIVREEQSRLLCEKCGKYPWKDPPL